MRVRVKVRGGARRERAAQDHHKQASQEIKATHPTHTQPGSERTVQHHHKQPGNEIKVTQCNAEVKKTDADSTGDTVPHNTPSLAF